MANNKKKRQNKNSYNFVPQPKKNAVKQEEEVKEEVVTEEVVAEEVADSVAEPVKNKKQDKADKSVKTDSKTDPKKDKKKKEKKPSRVKKGMKEIGSELKKVSWPTFRKVCKQTGIVIGVVAFFTLILFGIDRLASLLYTLLANSIK